MTIRSKTRRWNAALLVMEMLESRTLLSVSHHTAVVHAAASPKSSSVVHAAATGFSAWATISKAIANVPESAGFISSVSVINFGTTVYTGPLNVQKTLDRIRADSGPITSDDGTIFTNSEGFLPSGTTYYEFCVPPTNGTDRNFTFASPGPMRIVMDVKGDVYFTGDHYSTFKTVYTVGSGGGGGGGGSSGTMLGWDVAGQANFGTQGLSAGTIGTGITNSTGLTRGSGVTATGTAASGAWGGANWASTAAAGITGNEFITFGATVSTGHTLSLSAIDLNYRRSSSGATSGEWQYELNTGAWVTISGTSSFSSTSSSGAAMTELSLAGVSALQNIAAGTKVTLRLVPYGSTASGGTFYVYDLTGNDLVVKGSTT